MKELIENLKKLENNQKKMKKDKTFHQIIKLNNYPERFEFTRSQLDSVLLWWVKVLILV